MAWLSAWWQRLAIVAVLLVVAWLHGCNHGKSVEIARQNAATVKAVVHVAVKETEDKNDVANQNTADSARIAQLEAELAAERGKPARIVRVRDPARVDLPAAQGNAGAGETACPVPVDAGDDEAVTRQALIEFAGVAERLRLQVMSCQSQWPR